MNLISLKAKDFCCFENIELSLNNMGLVWIGGENKDSLAANNNGSGKSTIFKILTWTLYGKTIDGERGDNVIRDGCDCAKGEIVLGSLKRPWIVVRERYKASPSLTLIEPSGEAFKASKEDIQGKVIDLVGLDYDSFRNTVLYGQNDISRFASSRTRDSERKEILHKILQTSVFKLCHERVKEKKKKIKEKIEKKTAKIDLLKGKISVLDIDNLKERSENFEVLRLEEIKKNEKIMKMLRKEANNFLKVTKSKVSNKDEMKKRKKERDEFVDSLVNDKKIEKKLEDIQKEIKHNLKIIEKKNQLLGSFEGKIESLNDLLNGLIGERCSTCNSSLKKGEAKKHISKLKTRYKSHTEEYNRLADLSSSIYDVLNILREKEKKIKRRIVINIDVKQKINILEIELSSLKNKETEVKGEIELLKQKAVNCVEKARHIATDVESLKGKENPYKSLWLEADKKLKKYESGIKKLKSNLNKKTDNLTYYDFWAKGFSNRGLPSFILDGVMPLISERTNHYLNTLADGDIRVNFSTQKEMKSAKGTYRDEIDITIEVEGITGYPPSGGQLKKIEIATDLALMDLTTSRGSQINLLALDEVLDGLDEEGCQRVLMLLNELKPKRKSIFVISHESDMREIFERAIIVKKENGVSSLEMVM